MSNVCVLRYWRHVVNEIIVHLKLYNIVFMIGSCAYPMDSIGLGALDDFLTSCRRKIVCDLCKNTTIIVRWVVDFEDKWREITQQSCLVMKGCSNRMTQLHKDTDIGYTLLSPKSFAINHPKFLFLRLKSWQYNAYTSINKNNEGVF